jgi:beta-N-acetylhexosaminidase
MNFAPVADIWTNPANTVIGDRAFGTEPELVAEMTAAAVRGLRSSGVLAVIKHFPGHGDTIEDSHYNLAFYHHDRERFNQIEAIPFQRGIEAGTDGVMIGHIATPLFGTGNLPATFSSYLMEQVLRSEWGFEGLIVTDALDMRGLTNYYTHDEIVINAFVNGADVLLMPVNPEQAITAMIEAYREGRFSEERLNESLRRILEAKMQFTVN